MPDRSPPSDLTRLAAGVAGPSAACWAAATIVLGGYVQPDHSHLTNYISELGQSGALYADWVNWSGFLPIGLLVLLFYSLVGPYTPLRSGTRWLLSSLGWGYVLSAFFPCDPGCPCTGTYSVSQAIHNLTAAVAYPAMILGLMQAARTFRRERRWRRFAAPTVVCGAVCAIGFVLMILPALQDYRGLLQLAVEACSFGWVTALAWIAVGIRHSDGSVTQPRR